MSLTDLAAIASVLSSLAVVGSLIYLALQVRQTDRNQRTLLQQGTAARNMESIWKFVEPHNAGVVGRVWNGETDFTTAEATQLVYLMRALMYGFQDQFLLGKLSLVDSIQRATQEKGIQRILGAPAFRALWVSSRDTYASEFAAYVDGLIGGAPLGAPLDMAAQLKATAAGLKTTAAP